MSPTKLGLNGWEEAGNCAAEGARRGERGAAFVPASAPPSAARGALEAETKRIECRGKTFDMLWMAALMIWAKQGLIRLNLAMFAYVLTRGAARHPRFSLVCAVLVLPMISGAYMRRYLPLDNAELGRRFHQQKIPITFNVGATARFRNALIRLEEGGQLVITGKDAAGREWRFTTYWSAFGGAFFSADLDHNGKPDLIFAWNPGGVGLSPSMHIVTLMFDRDDRPIPCEMDGYFEIDANGVKDLLDLDGDGRAELIRQAYDDGYWFTSVYEAKDARWHLVKGVHGDRSFPLHTHLTNRQNRVPAEPMPGRHPIEDDLSNDAPL